MIGPVFMLPLEKTYNLNSAKKRAVLDNLCNKIKVSNSKPEICKKTSQKVIMSIIKYGIKISSSSEL